MHGAVRKPKGSVCKDGVVSTLQRNWPIDRHFGLELKGNQSARQLGRRAMDDVTDEGVPAGRQPVRGEGPEGGRRGAGGSLDHSHVGCPAVEHPWSRWSRVWAVRRSAC